MNESPIFSRTFDLIQWILQVTERFPRTQRFVLAKRIQDAGFGLQDSLLAAGMRTGAERVDSLRHADLELARVRFYLRLSHEMKWLSIGQYEHVSRMLDEVGRLLGGWLHKERETRPRRR